MLKKTSIWFDERDMKKLEALAKKDGLKASYLVRRAIAEYLKKHK